MRKTTCAPIIDIADLPPDVLEDPNLEQKKCRYCGRTFSSPENMKRHVRNACKIVPNEKNGIAGMEQLYEHTIRRQEMRIAALEEQNLQMVALMPHTLTAGEVGIQQHGNGTINVDNRKMINSNNNIVINVFGKESMDHVTPVTIRKILEESLRNPLISQAVQSVVLKTAMLIYSDPEHPENLTCYLPNKKTNDVLVHTNRNGILGWEVLPTSLVLPPMAITSIDAIFDNQPFDDAEMFKLLMVDLRAREQELCTGSLLRPVLVRNKDLLRQINIQRYDAPQDEAEQDEAEQGNSPQNDTLQDFTGVKNTND